MVVAPRVPPFLVGDYKMSFGSVVHTVCFLVVLLVAVKQLFALRMDGSERCPCF